MSSTPITGGMFPTYTPAAPCWVPPVAAHIGLSWSLAHQAADQLPELRCAATTMVSVFLRAVHTVSDAHVHQVALEPELVIGFGDPDFLGALVKATNSANFAFCPPVERIGSSPDIYRWAVKQGVLLGDAPACERGEALVVAVPRMMGAAYNAQRVRQSAAVSAAEWAAARIEAAVLARSLR